MNQLQLTHTYITNPDQIIVQINSNEIYHGPADVEFINFDPIVGINVLTVKLEKKSDGNFLYNNQTNQVEKDSHLQIKELVVESRYFRSLLTKCGIIEIDIKKYLSFPSKYLHGKMLTMEGSEYCIKFEFPIKNWMQIHKHGRILEDIQGVNQKVKEQMELCQLN